MGATKFELLTKIRFQDNCHYKFVTHESELERYDRAVKHDIVSFTVFSSVTGCCSDAAIVYLYRIVVLTEHGH